LTRARDRLYLGTVVKDGSVQAGRGSLAEVLPASLLAAMSGAVAVPGEPLRWRSHVLRAVGDAEERHADKLSSAPVSLRRPDAPEDCDFEPVDDRAIRRVSVATAIADADTLPVTVRAGQDSHRLLGTLVHRLVRRLGLDPSADADRVVSDLLHASEAVDTSESETVCRHAAHAYRALCAMPDVRDLYRAGAALHEVPFTMTSDGQIIRGTIDCIVAGDDAMTVLEFKTGRARPEHARQAELYGRAVAAMYPEFHVKTRVIYLGEAVV
jgi:ATP-dependent exoDNAse (exonuclease V) beta subunit